MTDETHVEWRDWGSEAFAEADDRDCPVLLSLSATWCEGCHEMDAVTYAEPRIAANVNEGFVPVRVDVDRHPRVRERYNMGGFPTTAFLTPEGELLTGAGYLDVDGMRQVLESVRQMWAEKGRSAGRVPRALDADLPPRGELTDAVESHLAGQLEVKYDEEHAGWGTDAKFPLPRTVEFALKRDRDRALRTLDAVRDHLADEVAGGFFRFAGTRDWGDVAYEKPLDTNAAVTRAFANAYLYTGDDAYLDPALDAVSFLTDDLWTGYGVGGSLGPGLGRAYYAAPAEDRADLDSPRRDLTVFAGGNALAADALLAVAAYTDDDRAREYAHRILDGLERDLIDADSGEVTRYRGSDEVGESDLLGDTAHVVSAYTRAAGVLGEGATVARAVADRAIDRLHVDGSFVDGPRSGAGLLDRPFRPLDGNVEMATALSDLAALTGDDRYRSVARETAEAFAGATERLGVQVAGYGSLVGRLLRGTTVIAVGDEPGSDLHRAAWRVADHEKVVAPNAHRDGAPSPEAVPEGSAVVLAGDTVSEPAESPDALLKRVAETAE
ncbi:YyaL domain-containing protein [Halorubrum pallidum]